MDYRSTCVNCEKSKCCNFYFEKFFPLLKKRKEAYALVWIPLGTRTNFNKTKILNKYFAWAVVDGQGFNLGFES